jgi:Kdo2-lipid IVA lauroyltransferase/acyltransferase
VGAPQPPRTAEAGPVLEDDRRVSLRHAVEYALLRLLLLLLSRLSWSGTARLGSLLGRFTFSVLRLRRKVALENLAFSFPSWSEERRLQVARACYAHFGVTFLELCLLARITPEELRQRVKILNPSVFERAREEGRGAVCLTGHLGNWEMSGAALAAHGFPTWAVVRRQRNRLVDAYVTRAREAGGLRVLPMDRSLRGILRALRGNGFVAFLADQDAGRDGLFVPFLGRPASTPRGPARFARLSGAPIIPGFALRQADGTYALETPEPVRVRTDLPPEEAEAEAVRRTAALLEEVVCRVPEQWFWMHRRWKTRPEAAASAREE